MFEIIFLGTSASAPSVRRSLPAIVVKHDEYRFLVDCGEGTQRQILQSGLGFKRLNKILITHGHLDHILGLAGLLSTFLRWETIESLEIYGGRTALDRIHDLLYGVVLRGVHPPMPIDFKQVKPGVIFKGGDLTISAFPVKHRNTDSFGYVFEEEGRRPFLVDKADELGIPSGPLRGQLVRGNEVALPDGRKVTPEMVLGEFKRGTKIVITGDLGDTQDLEKVCADADALVIEATYLKSEEDMARRFAHLTANQSATLAKLANVKKLLLTHISRRYREKDVLAEARAVFENTVVARDFDVYQIKNE